MPNQNIIEEIEGPCKLCGRKNYSLSMGGPEICPACDSGGAAVGREARFSMARAAMYHARSVLKAIELDPESTDNIRQLATEGLNELAGRERYM